MKCFVCKMGPPVSDGGMRKRETSYITKNLLVSRNGEFGPYKWDLGSQMHMGFAALATSGGVGVISWLSGRWVMFSVINWWHLGARTQNDQGEVRLYRMPVVDELDIYGKGDYLNNVYIFCLFLTVSVGSLRRWWWCVCSLYPRCLASGYLLNECMKG